MGNGTRDSGAGGSARSDRCSISKHALSPQSANFSWLSRPTGWSRSPSFSLTACPACRAPNARDTSSASYAAWRRNSRMHQFSLVHEQLSSENILVGNEQDDPRVQIAAVQHVSRRRRLKPDHLVAELTPLEASLAGMANIRATHRVRFLRACLGSRSAAEVRRIWHGVRSALAARAGVSLPLARRVTAGKASPPAPLARIASFLAVVAALVLTSAGCQTVEHPVSLPVRYSVPGDQLLVLSDFKLPKNHEFIRELNKLREQETQILELPVKRDPVIVYLFNNETEYRKYMTATYPRLPPRSRVLRRHVDRTGRLHALGPECAGRPAARVHARPAPLGPQACAVVARRGAGRVLRDRRAASRWDQPRLRPAAGRSGDRRLAARLEAAGKPGRLGPDATVPTTRRRGPGCTTCSTPRRRRRPCW